MNRVNGYIVLDDFLDIATEKFQNSSKSVKEGNLQFWLELGTKGLF